jgi:hypothetical protein
MDRQIIEVAAIPLDTDLLNIQKYVQKAIGYSLQATFGTNSVCDGLALSATSPATMSINIGSGSLITLQVTDASVFGSLPIDNNFIMKIGVNNTNTTMALSAPTVAGDSINYLIEACFSENDGVPVVLPYYNAANPAQPFSGPGNTGAAQNTVRLDTVSLRFKAGNQSATGTQNTPVVDSGYIALGVVTIAYGQTSITSSNIVNYLATRVGTKLGQLQTKLTSNLNLYVSSTNGANTNSGLSPNDALDTPQNAWNAIINNYNLNGYGVTINIAAGTYPSVVCAGQPQGFGAGSVILLTGAGASTIINSAALQSCISASNAANIQVANMLLEGNIGINCQNASQVFIIGGITFANCSGAHITSGGVIQILGGYSITGGATIHWQTVIGGSIITFNSPVITGTGTPSFTSAFASTTTGLINLNGLTFSGCGGFTGVRYNAAGGGFINTQTGNTSLLPGNVAGTVNPSTTYNGFYA